MADTTLRRLCVTETAAALEEEDGVSVVVCDKLGSEQLTDGAARPDDSVESFSSSIPDCRRSIALVTRSYSAENQNVM